ncbi:hypothetical protein M9Y10_022914 [Tritrichomonas musculus]|uniref:Uncharacterized protein n=1 Tax=Tritrichomonas musculus TaxID=1915356 RepID=A0ABR2KTN4_9EUKA
MEEHPLKEENAALRKILEQCQEKMKLLANALEERNEQMTELVEMYNQLQDEYRKAKDAAHSAADFLGGRDEMIDRLREIIQNLKNANLEQRKLSGQEIEDLSNGLIQERMRFIEALNKLSQVKVPAEEAFRKNEADLERKEKEFAELRQRFKELTDNFKKLSEENENRLAQIQRLNREKYLIEQENLQLNNQLAQIKSGYHQTVIIESFKQDIEAMRQKMHETLRQNKALKKALSQKEKQIIGIMAEIENKDAQINIFNEEICKYKDQEREWTQKIDEFRQKTTKSLQNEMNQVKRCQSLEAQNNCLNEQILMLQEKVDRLVKQVAGHANDRVKSIQNDNNYKTKIALIKKRAQEEVSKRISAEEAVYSVKEENFHLKKEIAILRDQLADAKMSDIEPLVQLLKDLRVELIEIDSEYLDLIKSIPPAQPIDLTEVPKGICESSAAIIAQIASKSSQIIIENQELRVVLQRISRFASTFHRIATVISKYPILSTDDIGMDEPYGNWVLPVDVEHLQRTVIKLHEILTRKRSQ